MGSAVGKGRSQNQRTKRPHSRGTHETSKGWAAHEEAGGQQDASRMQHCQMQVKGGEQGMGTRSRGATGAEKGCRGPAAFTELPALLQQTGL